MRAGIDIGGTKINIGLVEDSGTLLAARTLYVAEVTDLAAAVKSTLDALCHDVGGVPTFCGIGIPGTVSDDGRRILKAPNLALLPPDTAEQLETALVLPCRMVQDSRAAAWGEYKAGAGCGMRSVICVTLGTGIGTGIVLDGKIFAGALGCAGEMGHLPVVEDGRPCGCGKRGCLEKYAAGLGLDQTAEALLGPGRRLADLFAAAEAGDPHADGAIRDAVTMLGRALVAEVNLLSPDCLLLSGGLAERSAYADAVIDYVRTHCYAASRLPLIAKAALGEYAPLIGAALLNIA